MKKALKIFWLFLTGSMGNNGQKTGLLFESAKFHNCVILVDALILPKTLSLLSHVRWINAIENGFYVTFSAAAFCRQMKCAHSFQL